MVEVPDLSFGERRLAPAYLSELQSLVHSVIDGLDTVWEKAPPLLPSGTGYVLVDPPLHATLTHAVTDATRVAKLTRLAASQRKDESEAVYNLRRERIGFFGDILKKLRLRETTNPQLRNTIEHFDEHLDEVVVRIDANPAPAVALQNLVVSSWDVLKALPPLLGREIIPLRLYVAGDRVLWNLGQAIDVRRLWREMHAIKKAIAPYVHEDGPGGVTVLLN